MTKSLVEKVVTKNCKKHENMKIEKTCEKEYCLLEIAGTLSSETLHELRLKLEKAASLKIHILLDFSDLDFIDSTSVGIIVQTYNSCVKHSKEFIIINPGEAIMRFFSIINFNEHIMVFPSKNDAIRYVLHHEED